MYSAEERQFYCGEITSSLMDILSTSTNVNITKEAFNIAGVSESSDLTVFLNEQLMSFALQAKDRGEAMRKVRDSKASDNIPCTPPPAAGSYDAHLFTSDEENDEYFSGEDDEADFSDCQEATDLNSNRSQDVSKVLVSTSLPKTMRIYDQEFTCFSPEPTKKAKEIEEKIFDSFFSPQPNRDKDSQDSRIQKTEWSTDEEDVSSQQKMLMAEWSQDEEGGGDEDKYVEETLPPLVKRFSTSVMIDVVGIPEKRSEEHPEFSSQEDVGEDVSSVACSYQQTDHLNVIAEFSQDEED